MKKIRRLPFLGIPALSMSALLLAVAFLTISVTRSVAVSAASLINGAGATFPYPLYSKWFTEFQRLDPSIQINYQSIGSGGGIQQLLSKTVDFGASDAPMSDEQLKASGDSILHIPTVLGAVVVSYNLSGLKGDLNLSPDALADIYLGKIKKWNDRRLVELNASLHLPDQDILVVSRSDGSGTTNIFTDYLSKVSPEWKAKVGKGTSIHWPVGLGGKGNEGVSGLVKQNPASIGYVELIYAVKNGMSYAALKNQAGHFVKPSLASVTAAAALSMKTIPADFRVSITDAPGVDSYPISGFTYLLIYRVMPKASGTPIVKFLHWALSDGQKYAAELQYAPLPRELVKRVESTLNGISLR